MIYLRNARRDSKISRVACGENKININYACVCDASSGYLPMLGGFGVSHEVCHLCDVGDIKEKNGQKFCDFKDIGTTRDNKIRGSEGTEQCAPGFVLRDSKCEPLGVTQDGQHVRLDTQAPNDEDPEITDDLPPTPAPPPPVTVPPPPLTCAMQDRQSCQSPCVWEGTAAMGM